MNCKYCHHNNPNNANFCSNCGRPQKPGKDTKWDTCEIERFGVSVLFGQPRARFVCNITGPNMIDAIEEVEIDATTFDKEKQVYEQMVNKRLADGWELISERKGDPNRKQLSWFAQLRRPAGT